MVSLHNFTSNYVPTIKTQNNGNLGKESVTLVKDVVARRMYLFDQISCFTLLVLSCRLGIKVAPGRAAAAKLYLIFTRGESFLA
jgi:hypothetical protein